ncbi:MAG: glycosyltransferase family 4 protein [Chloroflexia bacterium]|nr:glycosyltransferase family 4 protein [Chloroflexia bacterium]
MQNAGHQVKVFALYKGKSEYVKDVDLEIIELSILSKVLITTIRLFKKRKLKSSLELRIQAPNHQFKKLVKGYQPDVIVLKAYQNLLALKTLIIARKFRAKVLMLTQTSFTHIKGSKALFRWNIKLFKKLGVHAYITPIQSNFVAFKDFGINNVFYLPFVFPAATHFSQNKSHKNSDLIKIISIGKFVKRKDQLLLFKACHQLINKGYKIELSIFGEVADIEYLNILKNYIGNNGLNKNITIFTNIPYNELLNQYTKHDIFVLPGYAEPAAYSPVEAMAFGLPIIVSNDCGTKCYIKDGENGYVFEAKNQNDLTQKLELLISEKDKLKKMSENSLLLAHEKHALETFESKIIQIING